MKMQRWKMIDKELLIERVNARFQNGKGTMSVGIYKWLMKMIEECECS